MLANCKACKEDLNKQSDFIETSYSISCSSTSLHAAFISKTCVDHAHCQVHLFTIFFDPRNIGSKLYAFAGIVGYKLDPLKDAQCLQLASKTSLNIL